MKHLDYMTKSLGELFGRKSITQERNWVIVKNGQIVEHYESFEDAIQDNRGHLITELYYLNHYKNLDI